MRERDKAPIDRTQQRWLSRPLSNWWLRGAFPAVIVFGGALVVRILSLSSSDIGLYAALAALAMMGLIVGLLKARRRSG